MVRLFWADEFRTYASVCCDRKRGIHPGRDVSTMKSRKGVVRTRTDDGTTSDGEEVRKVVFLCERDRFLPAAVPPRDRSVRFLRIVCTHA